MSSSETGTSAKNKKKMTIKTSEEEKKKNENQEETRKSKRFVTKNIIIIKPETSSILNTVENTYLGEAGNSDCVELGRNQEELSCATSSSSSLGSAVSPSSSPDSTLCVHESPVRRKFLPPEHSVSTLCAHFDQRCRTALHNSVGKDDGTIVGRTCETKGRAENWIKGDNSCTI